MRRLLVEVELVVVAVAGQLPRRWIMPKRHLLESPRRSRSSSLKWKRWNRVLITWLHNSQSYYYQQWVSLLTLLEEGA